MSQILRLSGALLRHVGSFLCWLDRTALSQCCTSAHSGFRPSSSTDQYLVGNAGFRKEVIKRLGQEKIDGELFCRLLQEHKCVLTGSFPLQCALGVRWQEIPVDEELNANVSAAPVAIEMGVEEGKLPYDATAGFGQTISFRIVNSEDYRGDIYATRDGQESIYHEWKRLPSDIDVLRLGKCGDRCNGEWDGHRFEFVNALMGDSCTAIENGRHTYDGFEGTQMDSRKWSCGDTILNMVTLGPNSVPIKLHIETSFDFAFVKLAFDGQRLSICDWNSLVNRGCEVDVYSEVRARHELWGGLGSIHDIVDNAIQVLDGRVKKYRDRGFKIELRKLDWLDVVYDDRYAPP